MSSGSKTYFEDLKERQPLKCRTVKFTRESIIAFAAQFDPQPVITYGYRYLVAGRDFKGE